MRIRTLIVDDEPPAHRVLEKYLADLQEVELVASCTDTAEARNILSKKEVDLLFLDIRMPEESGLDFARSLKSPPMIIFTTAFPEYAVEGFELEAVDYLVKPFSKERFRKAIERVIYLRGVESSAQQTVSQKDFVLIKSDKKLYRMLCREILYLESVGDYVKVYSTRTRPLLPKITLKMLIEEMPADKIVQVHRSYAVALDAIQYVEGNQVCVNDTLIPVSETYRRALNDKLRRTAD
jgi:DNA-binding LytR/AlgR family response regulator